MLARVEAPTPIDAYAGRLVWSAWQPDGTFRLQQYVDGVVSDMPVTGGAVPFDVDLGPGPNGGPVAVYSRCRVSPASTSPESPDERRTIYSAGRGCRIFMFSFASGRERRLRKSPRRSEYQPAIWRNRLSFFSSPERRRSPARTPSLFVRTLGTQTRVKRLPVGSRELYDRSFEAPTPVDVDLRGRRVAFTWGGVWTTRLCPGTADRGYSGDARRTEAWTVTVGGVRRRLARVCEGLSGPRLSSAALTGDGTTFLRRPEAGSRLVRIAHRGTSESLALQPPTFYEAALAGSRLYYQRAVDGDFEIGFTETPR